MVNNRSRARSKRGNKRLNKGAKGSKATGNKHHLFVLHHGLWGIPGHVKYISEQLKKQLSENTKGMTVSTLLVKSNQTVRSYSGIRTCADRMKKELVEATKTEKPSHISFIGYSAGGLITRYCVALLEEDGFFGTVVPVNLILFASPNAGIYRFRSPHFFRNCRYQAYNFFTSRFGWFVGGRTVQELALQDDERAPLLHLMSLPPFLKTIEMFKLRVVLGNIFNDHAVPFESSALYHIPEDEEKCAINPYEKHGTDANPYSSPYNSPARFIATKMRLSDETNSKISDVECSYAPRDVLVNAVEPPHRCDPFFHALKVSVFAVFLFPLFFFVWVPFAFTILFPSFYLVARMHYSNARTTCEAEDAARRLLKERRGGAPATRAGRFFLSKELIQNLKPAFNYSVHCWLPGFTTHGTIVARNYKRKCAPNAKDGKDVIDYAIRSMRLD
jgi:hypothetical protein